MHIALHTFHSETGNDLLNHTCVSIDIELVGHSYCDFVHGRPQRGQWGNFTYMEFENCHTHVCCCPTKDPKFSLAPSAFAVYCKISLKRSEERKLLFALSVGPKKVLLVRRWWFCPSPGKISAGAHGFFCSCNLISTA